MMTQMCSSYFKILLYWVNRADMQCKVHLERSDGLVLVTNAICPDFGQKCLQLLVMLTLTNCDTTSYPYDKRNATALNTI